MTEISAEPRGSAELEVVNPATGVRIGTAPVLDAAEVAALAERGRKAQLAWQALGFDGRAVVFRRMQQWMADHADEILEAVQAETGRVFEDSVLELAYPLTALGHWADNSGKYLRSKRIAQTSPFVLGKKMRAHYVPHGLVGIIAPWNFPITIGFGDSIPALAAGNAVILKPSEITPLSIEIVRRGLIECGMPRAVFQVATGAGATGAAVVDVVDMVMFTGSTATGRKIGAQAAQRLIPVSLELGGKDPMIVLADANIERAANLAVFGANVNSGQVCLSTERFYVEAPVYDEFVARVVAKVKALRQGVPVAPGAVDVGAIITEAQVGIIDAQVRDAQAKGARVLVGGKPVTDGPGRFYQPTVLVGVDHSMTCMTEETFGPLIPIMKVADAEEAVRLANDSKYGLAATIMTRDHKRGERLARRIEAGSVSVNDMLTHCFALGLPMGGVKTSGIGTRHGADGIRKFCKKQAVLVARSFPNRDVHFYPTDARISPKLLKAVQLLYGTAGKVANLRPRARLAARKVSRID
ncbi:acyl-CoA reductase-like NAD-dependent aldehyde dehydrogenase [Nocardia tenerifensis]|uniref:Aldehyde dehydrogenase n=1 Tax=Nocardia tenerifensis TaxID=228006 RepID=A0A318JVV3_9NOCA|nr:aldehyde dehydrogenase family protein [Nocardia tenerifensis]PXX58443.1 acyl-CoA reductase-like NAD-dependent aldehyde dehydrogenase [Nocardia tenerifensis]